MSSASRHVVLLVEDEPLIRLDTSMILEDAGYDVLEASNALQALAALESHPEIEILFTDINMPGPMNGLELARRVHAARPAVRLVVTSGKIPPAEAVIPDEGAFIAKPYSPETVARVMSRVMS
jgi:CheY-like chemotaxis protein